MVHLCISEMSKDAFHKIIISVLNIIILVIYIINFIIFVLSLSVFRIIVSISEFFAKPFSVSKHSVVLCLLMKLIPAKYNSKHKNSSGAELRPLCLSYQYYYMGCRPAVLFQWRKQYIVIQCGFHIIWNVLLLNFMTSSPSHTSHVTWFPK